MAWTLKAHVAAAAASNPTTAAINTTGADLIILSLVGLGTSGFVPTDSASNTWTPLTRRGDSGSGASQLFYSHAPTTSSSHTFSTTGSFFSIFVAAFSGSSVSPFDQQNGTGSLNASSFQPGAITPLADGELIMSVAGGFANGVNTSSIDSGFTILDQETGSGGNWYGGTIAYLVQTTAASVNPTFTLSGSSAGEAIIASFKGTGGAAATTSYLPLMGCG